MTITPLELARKKRQELKEQGLLQNTTRRGPLEWKILAPFNRKRLITAHCFECVGGDLSPNWREEVKHCVLIDKCALWNVRPYRTEEEKIRQREWEEKHRGSIDKQDDL